MRKPLLSLGLVAVLAAGCTSAAAPTSPNGGYVKPPEHHQPPACCEPAPSFVAAPTPYDGVTFADPATNPFVDPHLDNQSTFGLDIDTASYSVARRFIDDGNLPDPASVRVEEFVNYFDQGYAAPETTPSRSTPTAVRPRSSPPTRRSSGSASRPATSPTTPGRRRR
jgi:Ca-activated chloride channel family protein